jgi:predicted alpha/beta superfamily hydrolase
MKIRAFILFLLLGGQAWMAGAQVTFILESIPGYTPEGDIIYIAGDFNGWNPGNQAQALSKNQEGLWWITLPARASGTQIQYKFTRGTWAKVEKGASGEEISNRRYTYKTSADTVRTAVLNWADRGGDATTAAKNVIKLSNEFPMPQLGRTRRIWVYLPPDYESSARHYPVMYMHDGQNVFDAYTSFAGEWEVDENLNDLAESGREVPIVVAIDNGGTQRIDEYSPWRDNTYGGGQGNEYIDFIINTLKPHIDSVYRTRPGRDHTGIMGSSMGGLISLYGALKRPDVFGKAGVFSPSYWFSDSLWTFARDVEKQHPMRIYQLAGTGEGSSTVNNVLGMEDSLKQYGFSGEEVKSRIVQGAGHNEAFWRSEFREAYLWLFPEISGIPDIPALNNKIRIYPNPAGDILKLEMTGITGPFQLKIFNNAGMCIKNHLDFRENTINISDLPAGKYLVHVETENIKAAGWFIKY